MLFNIRPNQAHFNFMGKRKIAFTFSILLTIVTIISIFTRGFNFGIDFSGGIVIEMRTQERVELGTIRNLLSSEEFGEISLQNFGSDNDVLIRVSAQEGESESQLKTVEKIKDILSRELPTQVEYRKVDFVGPQVGSELIFSGFISLLLAFTGMMIYIWMRFEWQFGLGGIIAIIHDAVMTLGVFSVLQIEFNLTSIAAILTIIGYSINDSVVIYDRIRENMRKFKKMPLEELINASVNTTLSRTLLTAGSTIVALIALVLFGGDVIRGFSGIMLFGIIFGTYSSIYISAPILLYLNVRNPAAQQAAS